MSIKKRLLVSLVIFLSIIYIFAIEYPSTSRMSGDTALFSQITANIWDSGRAESNIFANTQNYLERHISAIPIDDRIKMEDDSLQPVSIQTRNMLQFHHYLILYLISPLCAFFSSYVVITLAQSISYVFLLFFSWLILEENRVHWIGKAIVLLIIILHPGWSISAASGSFYPDRLFFGIGMYLIWACQTKKFSLVHFCISATLCAMVGERAAIYAGMFIIVQTIFYWKQNRHRKLRLVVGFMEILYSIYLFTFVLNNMYYGGNGILSYLMNLQDPIIRERIYLFCIINILLFGIISIFDYRAAAIAIGSMLPNIFYNVGGAEKLGWYLHYHSYYFPVLVWAVIMGACAFYNKYKNCVIFSKVKIVWIGSLGAMLLLVGICCLNPFNVRREISPKNMNTNFITSSIRFIKTNYMHSGSEIFKGYFECLQTTIPEKAKVSSIEFGMTPIATIKSAREIYPFPVGIKTAEYAIVSYQTNNGKTTYSGSFTYYGPEETARLNSVLFEEMKNLGYNFDEAVLYPAYGVAVISRK